MIFFYIRILISKFYRKRIKGTLSTIYYRLAVSVAKKFPDQTTALLGFHKTERNIIAGVVKQCENGEIKDNQFNFHFSNREIETIVKLIPQSLKLKAIDEAEDLLSNKFYFKNTTHTFSGGIDWFIEPAFNKGWRWDLNRHLFLLTFAKAYLYTGNPVFIERIDSLIRDWCERNPLNLNNPNWNEPFEVAARLNNWIWLYFFIKDIGKKPEFISNTLLEGIYTHSSYLYRFMEIHIPNNHLLLEAKALYSASLVLSYASAAEKWYRKSSNYLQKEFKRQVRNDGGHTEQAITYHRIVNSEMLETYALSSKNQDSKITYQLADRVLAMTEFTNSMMRPDGSFPLTGDSSSTDTYYRFNPFMIAATFFNKPDFKNAAIQLGEDDLTYFVLGAKGVKEYLDMPISPELKPSRHFPDSGYYVMRDESLGIHAIIDCGPFGNDKIPGHGHDDILSFDLSLKNSPLIVDSGNYDLPMAALDAILGRQYFRGANSHNVLIVDECNRSELIGYWDTINLAKPLNRKWYTDDKLDYFCGSHDGYLSSLGIIHQREIILVKGRFFCIIDKLLGDGPHNFELIYHLAPDNRASVSDEGLVNISNKEGVFCDMIVFGATGNLQIMRGQKAPGQGWFSPESGCLIPIDTVCFSSRANLSTWIGTLIQLHSGNHFHVNATTRQASNEIWPRFSLANGLEIFGFSSKSKITKQTSRKLDFHASFTIEKQDQHGKELLFETR